LNKEGHEVITAYDGEEGLNKALVESPDLIILEPMLSKIHGFTLCGMITREFKKNIPVIIISKHYTDENFKKEALRTHGASGYMVRPITKSELRTVIEDVFRGQMEEPEVEKPAELDHPGLASDTEIDETPAHKTQEVAEPEPEPQETKSDPEETKKDKDDVNIDELLTSQGIIVNKPKMKPPADKENGAMKKIGAILTTEISFNKIRERLRTAVENEEISSVKYKEPVIPGEIQNGPQSEADDRAEATASQDPEQQSAVSNNGKEPRKAVTVDKMLDEIMDEFGLSGTNAEHRSKPSI
jgi:CheY-like chemotaxis protein